MTRRWSCSFLGVLVVSFVDILTLYCIQSMT